ncbi:hypothetical protein [Microseira wollei]|nr:hypothetical protein [Microseira wollei]
MPLLVYFVMHIMSPGMGIARGAGLSTQFAWHQSRGGFNEISRAATD